MSPSTFWTVALGLAMSWCPAALFGQVRVAPDDAEKLALSKLSARYPPEAAAGRIQGPVLLDITVSEAGSVSEVKLIYGHPLLRDAAISGAKRRKYRPYLVEGRPTAFITVVGDTFTIDASRLSERELGRRYLELRNDCLRSTGNHQWSEAESVCSGALWMAGQMAAPGAKVDANNNIGSVYLLQGRFDTARDYLSRALAGVQPGSEKGDVSYVYRNLGLAAQGLGDLSKARESFAKAEALLDRALASSTDQKVSARYSADLKSILNLHLKTAQQAGATQEAGEIENRLAALP